MNNESESDCICFWTSIRKQIRKQYKCMLGSKLVQSGSGIITFISIDTLKICSIIMLPHLALKVKTENALK